MIVVQDGLYDRLADSADVTSVVSTYRGQPSIFSRTGERAVPSDAAGIWVVINAPLAAPSFDTKTSDGKEVTVDIAVYGDDTGDPAPVDDLAEIIRLLLHRRPVQVVGYVVLISKAIGPIEAPVEDSVYGRIVTVQLTLIKEN